MIDDNWKNGYDLKMSARGKVLSDSWKFADDW